jgi:adenine phosphoribosyltransferase
MSPEAARGDLGQALAELVAGGLRDVADFPIDGVVFKDITPLLADPHAFTEVTRALATLAEDGIELVAGVEARGFLLAGALALELGCGMVPVRKAGKLPPPTISRSYALEYGTAELGYYSSTTSWPPAAH